MAKEATYFFRILVLDRLVWEQGMVGASDETFLMKLCELNMEKDNIRIEVEPIH